MGRSSLQRPMGSWGRELLAPECPALSTELQDLMPISRARKPPFILSSMRDEKRK